MSENKPWVRLTKIAVRPDALYQASKPEDYNYQNEEANTLSTPLGYVVEGYLLRGPEIGRSVRIDRRMRNQIWVDGYYFTSVVTAIAGDKFVTLNSTYRLEVKPEPTR